MANVSHVLYITLSVRLVGEETSYPSEYWLLSSYLCRLVHMVHEFWFILPMFRLMIYVGEGCYLNGLSYILYFTGQFDCA